MRPADVVIIGAGVIGASIAYTLSRSSRLRIVVVERGLPGGEASNAAAGVLAVASGQARRGVLFELRRVSASLFPELVAALQEETGIDVGYRRAGLISLAFSDSEAVALQELVGHRLGQGTRCEMLTGAEVRSLEPAVNARVRAGALFPDDHSIHNEQLVAALVVAARRRGVEFRMPVAVQSISSVRNAVRLAVEEGGIEAGHVVVAAGAWSRDLLMSCDIKVPVRPARGEMAAVCPTTWGVHHTLTAGDGYLVPRDNGQVLIGSTTAFVGFDKRVTREGLATLRARATAIVPCVEGTTFVRSWAGLRPCSTIRRPIIGPLPNVDNVILATGHHRNGILLAPVTAQMVTEMITAATPSISLKPFSYRRH